MFLYMQAIWRHSLVYSQANLQREQHRTKSLTIIILIVVLATDSINNLVLTSTIHYYFFDSFETKIVFEGCFSI